MTAARNEFLHFEERTSDHPFVEKVWRCHSDRNDSFLSVAANSFEMALTRLRGETFLTFRGPETAATAIECPAEGQWVGIRFKPGVFMPRFLPGSLRNHNDVTLPSATARSFWLAGSALDYPNFDNAETFVKRLVKVGPPFARLRRRRRATTTPKQAILALRTTPFRTGDRRDLRYVSTD